MQKRVCKVSGDEFIFSSRDLDFYRNNDYPLPTLSPDERLRRRMSFCNQVHLYHNKCAGTGKKLVSNYSPDKNIPVLDVQYFFSDKWDKFSTAREYDFDKPFFVQFDELQKVAPRPALQRGAEFDENADYTNHAGKNKNCYLIFDSDKNRDCYYSYSLNSCESLVDCFRAEKCELCYSCIDCVNCYDSSFLQNCSNCSSSHFLKNCIGCNDCFASVNLRNKQYCFFNEQLSAEEYRRKIKILGLDKRSKQQAFYKQFIEYAKQFPHKEMEGVQNEDVQGNYLTNCKNAYNCFDSRNLWDCDYIHQGFDSAKNCRDCTEVGDGVESCYESAYVGYSAYNVNFTACALGQTSDLYYCYYCPHSSNCFGCVGLPHAEYCILNKQYSKKEYQELLPKIISHMKHGGEWGEFFSTEISPFCYNETHAFEYYPLSKEEVLSRGWSWKEEEEKKSSVFAIANDSISEIDDDILTASLSCDSCSKLFKIVSQELKFYRQQELPIPSKCWHCRYLGRLSLRNPRELFQRSCNQCDKSVQTTYSPQRAEPVYCEKCYSGLVE